MENKNKLIKRNTDMFKRLEDFKRKDLAKLRSEIVLNSLFYADYNNSFGINIHDVAAFFDGYYDFIWELAYEKAEEEGKGTSHLTHNYVMENFDNTDTLEEWYYCHDDFSWVRYYDKEQYLQIVRRIGK